MVKDLVGACVDAIDGLAYAIGFIEAISPRLDSEAQKQSLMVMETLGSYTVDIKKAITGEIRESN